MGFPFKELLLTNKVFDILGFSEYWGGCGEFGDRRLNLGGQVGDERLTSKKEYPSYFIYELDETEAGSYGYEYIEYCPNHFANKDFQSMYFLHEMYEDILVRRTPEEIEAFIKVASCKELSGYLQSYIDYKNKTPLLPPKE